MQHEGAGASESAHEEAELEQHVVARTERFGPAAEHEIVGGQDEDGEVEARQGAEQRLDESLAEGEDPLVPDRDLGIRLEPGVSMIAQRSYCTPAVSR